MQRRQNLPDDFHAQLVRLVRAGYHIMPAGGGDDGKSPLGNWAGPKMTLGQIIAPIYRTGILAYAVRLDSLAVIDCDVKDPALVQRLEARFGLSPVHVDSPRGFHLYYRKPLGKLPNLRSEGLPVDIKSGRGQIILGPMSQRPDGGHYSPAKGLLGVDALPLLRLSTAPPSTPQMAAIAAGSIANGDRHNRLVKEAMNMVAYVDSAEELFGNVAALRDDYCQDAATLPDAELWGIVKWAWKCRLENRLFTGRDSDLRISRLALDSLRRLPNEGDCLALYMLLLDMHGHSNGKRFALDFKAMRESGLTQLSIPRLRAARRALQSAGLLKLVGNHRAGSVHQTFMLAKPLTKALGNVEVFPPMYHPQPQSPSFP